MLIGLLGIKKMKLQSERANIFALFALCVPVYIEFDMTEFRIWSSSYGKQLFSMAIGHRTIEKA